MNVDPLTIALIRALDAAAIGPNDTDELLIDRFGQRAQIMADGLRQVIREEVQRQVEASARAVES